MVIKGTPIYVRMKEIIWLTEAQFIT
ncbi:hypothetical protein JFL43_00680 [Viridibacillus sp. YIM B01967]|uniref:Uncharacterized protein n=1 Tax=Viridibacillus soli TaxID=2798301 RepID=A0ABS1H1W3_9BACL|nr:hypothetical protein [Viridibacillus soli]